MFVEHEGDGNTNCSLRPSIIAQSLKKRLRQLEKRIEKILTTTLSK